MQNQLLISLIAVSFLWLCSSIFLPSTRSKAEIVQKSFLAIVTLLLGGVLFQTQRDQAAMSISMDWAKVQSDFGLSVNIKLDSFRATVLMYLQLAFLTFYFLNEEKKQDRHIYLLPLISLAAILMVGSENIFTFMTAGSLSLIASSVAVGMGERQVEQRANAYVMWISTRLLGLATLIIAAVAMYKHSPTLSFQEIEGARDEIGEWIKITMLVGLMVYSFNFPLTNAFRSAHYAGKYTSLIFGTSVTLFVGTLLSKLHMFFLSIHSPEIVVPVLLISLFLVSVFMLSERDQDFFTMNITLFMVTFMILSSVLTLPNTSYLLVITTFISTTLISSPATRGKRDLGFVVLTLLSLLGIPLFSHTWALFIFFEEMFSIIQKSDGAKFYFFATVTVIATISLFLFSLSVCGYIRELWKTKVEKVDQRPVATVFVGISAVLLFSIFSGAPALASMMNKLDLSWAKGLQWFSAHVLQTQDTGQPFQWAIFLLMTTTLSAMLFSFGVFFKNSEKEQSTKKFVNNLLVTSKGSAASSTDFQIIVWKIFLRPCFYFLAHVTKAVNKISMRAFNGVIDSLQSFAKDLCKKVEEKIVDRQIYENLGAVFEAASRAARVMQVGQVQFYIGFGILVFTGIVYRLLYFMLR